MAGKEMINTRQLDGCLSPPEERLSLLRVNKNVAADYQRQKENVVEKFPKEGM